MRKFFLFLSLLAGFMKAGMGQVQPDSGKVTRLMRTQDSLLHQEPYREAGPAQRDPLVAYWDNFKVNFNADWPAHQVFEFAAGKVYSFQYTAVTGSPGAPATFSWRAPMSIYANPQTRVAYDGIPFDLMVFHRADQPYNKRQLLPAENSFSRLDDLNVFEVGAVFPLREPAASGYRWPVNGGSLALDPRRYVDFRRSGVRVSVTLSFFLDRVNRIDTTQSDFVKGTRDSLVSYNSHYNTSWGPFADTLYWNSAATSDYSLNGELIGKHAALGLSGVKKFTPSDPLSFFQTGKTTLNNLQIGNVLNNGHYFFSFTSEDQWGIIPNSTAHQLHASGNAALNLGKHLEASLDFLAVNGSESIAPQGLEGSNIMEDILLTPVSFDNTGGTADWKNSASYLLPDGSPRNATAGNGPNNPYFDINQNMLHNAHNRWLMRGDITYRPKGWMDLHAYVGTDGYENRMEQQYAPGDAAYPQGFGYHQYNRYRQLTTGLEWTLRKHLAKHLSGSIVLSEAYLQRRTGQQFQGDSLLTGAGTNPVDITQMAARQENLASATARIYGFKGLDLSASAGVESDWTDRITSWVPSLLASYDFAPLFRMKKPFVFPSCKVYVTASKTGQQPDPYQFGGYDWSALSNGQSYLLSSSLQPEWSQNREAGMDLSFLQYRLNLHIHYYHQSISGLILPQPLAPSSGYTVQISNAGKMQNNGEELELELEPVQQKNVTWTLGAGMNLNQNKVLSLGDSSVHQLELYGNDTVGVYAMVGQPLGVIYGTRWLRDANLNPVVDDNTGDAGYGYILTDHTKGILGNVNPDFTVNIFSTLTVHQHFSISLTAEIRQGGKIYNGTRAALNYYGRSQITDARGDSVIFAGVEGHYDNQGNLVSYGFQNLTKAAVNQAFFQGVAGPGGAAEQFVQDASYVRLSTLVLCYSFPDEWLAKSKISQVRISLIGKNLWLHTLYDGVDPAAILAGSHPGMAYFNLPSTKTYGLSLQATF